MSLQALAPWPIVRLADVLMSIENGSRPSGGVDQYRTGVPSLGGEHLDNDGGFNFAKIKYVPLSFFRSMSKGIIQPEDILVVKDGATTGKVSYIGNDFPYATAVINEHIFILRVKANIVLPEFAFFFLFSDWGQAQIRRSYQGAAIGGINQDFVNRIEIPLPSLPEQKHIVTILRHAADLHRQRSEADKLAQRIIPALFNEMFGVFINGDNSDSLGNFVHEFRYGTSNKSSSKGQPVLRIPNVVNEILDLSDLKTTEVSNDDFERLRLQESDILFVRSNGNPDYVGRSAIFESAIVQKVGLDPTSFIYASYLIRARLKSDRINPYFLQYYLASTNGRIELRKRIRTSAGQYNINTDGLASIPVPIPPLELQNRFAEIVAKVRLLSQESVASSFELDLLGLSILNSAFSGELTNVWRNKHEVELHISIEQRDEWLKSLEVRRSVLTPMEVERPVITGNILLTRLSKTQQRVYTLAQNHPNPYFTLQTLWEGQDDGNPLDRDEIGSGLSMLEALGAILKVSVPVSPTGEAFYQDVYRLAAAHPIEKELRALKDRYPNIKL